MSLPWVPFPCELPLLTRILVALHRQVHRDAPASPAMVVISGLASQSLFTNAAEKDRMLFSCSWIQEHSVAFIFLHTDEQQTADQR